MNFHSFKKLAAVSVLALSTALVVGNAIAANVQSGSPTTVPITATILNSLTYTKTDLSFGTIGAIAKAADNAVATVGPGAVTLTDDPGAASTDARIVKDKDNVPSVATISITGYASTPLFIDYSGVTDMTDGTKTLYIVQLVDNLNAPTTGVGTQLGRWRIAGGAHSAPAGNTQQGQGTTTAGGVLAWKIGGSFATDEATSFVYPNGLYSGDFDVTVSY